MTSSLYSEPERHLYLDRAIRDPHHNLILDHLLGHFSAGAGTAVVEIGAGTGRYTEMLLSRGLRVMAIEPDQVLARKLERRLAGARNLDLRIGTAYDSAGYPDEVKLVCGFHVLHHIDDLGLARLGATLRALWTTRKHFGGWFFMEPNPLNMLYFISILLSPNMSFAEERGIWRSNWQELLAPERETVTLGTIGLFPPRDAISRLPGRVLRTATRLSRRRSLVRSYKILGVKKREEQRQ